MDELKGKIKQITGGMSFGQQVGIVVTVLIFIFAMVMIVRWAMQPDYALLFANLDLKEADQIVETLKTANVPYKITGGGSSIQIPSSLVYEWRMRLATEGLPSSGGVGYEIFDKKEIGISDFVQQLNYRRALEGELARTITGIEGIEQARVHIVVPKDRLFKEDQKEPTASIIVKFHSGRNLGENQIQGITHLVASSVEGLTPENVTVVDSRGKVLSRQWEPGGMMGLSSSQLDLKKRVETHLEDKVQSMLDPVLGDGKAIIRVTADLNFQRIDRTDERYDPDNTAVLSEERNEESNSDNAGNPFARVERSITNYQVPKTIERITNSVGNIQRLSVAVLVDDKETRTMNAVGIMDSVIYQPRSSEEIDMYASIVRNAVGFDANRGDQIEIQNVRFDTESPEMEMTGYGPGQEFWKIPSFWINIGQKALPILMLIIFFLMLRSRWNKIKLSLPPVAGLTPSAALSGNVSVEEMAVPQIDEGVSPEARESAKLLKQISQFAEEKPSLTVRLIRYWLVEE